MNAVSNVIDLNTLPSRGPSQLSQASRQWASRPDDERFLSLTEMQSHCERIRAHSAARVVPNRSLQAVPVEGDNKALRLMGPSGAPVDVTNWAFGQLAQRAGAPAGYLRDLPAPLAADCINYGLRYSREVEEMGVLLTRDDERTTLRAATGPNYGRIWNADIVRALVDRYGDGITGDFRVPGEFGQRVEVSKANTTLYASDRDMFVFLADESNRIEVKNRRDGKTGSLARGFFVWNSETGAGSYGVAFFLFDFACMNRTVWGAEGYTEIRGRHTSGAPDRWLSQVAPSIEAFRNGSASVIERRIEAAQSARIPDVDAFLSSRFSGKVAEAVKMAHVADEGRPIESLWDASVAVTAYARGIEYQDQRVSVEREGGKILSLADAA